MIAKAILKVLNCYPTLTKMITKDHKLYPKFEALLMQLSPENLYCDGESTEARVRLKLKRIYWEWTLLESMLESKCKVTQQDIENIFIANLKA